MNTPLVALISGLLVATALVWAGYRHGSYAARLELEAYKRQAAEASVKETNALIQAMQAAQERADALTRELADANALAAKTRKERDNALKTKTSGKPCLSADAVQLLNTSNLPKTAGSTAGKNAGNAATDTDVAFWASDAQSRYAECARRLNALIRYEEER